MLVTLDGMAMLVNPVQPSKAELPMLVTLSGMAMLVKPVQPWKTLGPMLVTLLGMAMLVKPVQPWKASFLIFLTLFGMIIFVIPVFLPKPPITVTFHPSIREGILTSMEVPKYFTISTSLPTGLILKFFSGSYLPHLLNNIAIIKIIDENKNNR